jgi:hypothetical protein
LTRRTPRLRLSRFGFNRDSTLASARVVFWCGVRCAHGATALLARRAGHRWRVWHYVAHWVS